MFVYLRILYQLCNLHSNKCNIHENNEVVKMWGEAVRAYFNITAFA